MGEFTDFSGKTVVVTGANSGIGLAGAGEFARRGARVGLVGRDPDRLASAVSAVPGARGFAADFSSLDSVRTLAAQLAEAYPAIDVLCNNAGAIVQSRQSTVDGHELTMQTNHLAPFLLRPERGADTMVWLAGAPAAELANGGYYVKRQLRRPSGIAADPAAASALWEASRTAVGL